MPNILKHLSLCKYDTAYKAIQRSLLLLLVNEYCILYICLAPGNTFATGQSCAGM